MSKLDDFSKYSMLYSAWDIAKMRNITVKGARKFMKNLGIPEHFIGNKVFYWMSDIQTYCPEFIPSLIEASQLNQQLDEKLQEEKDQE